VNRGLDSGLSSGLSSGLNRGLNRGLLNCERLGDDRDLLGRAHGWLTGERDGLGRGVLGVVLRHEELAFRREVRTSTPP
jgi:hypothetical protein